MGIVRIGMGEFGRGELHSPCFYWGNIFVLNSIVLNLIWANSFGANRLFGRMRFGANAIRPYGNIIHRIAILLDCFH